MEEFLLELDAQAGSQGVHDHEPDVVTGARVAVARVPEPDDHEGQELLLFFLGLFRLLGALHGTFLALGGNLSLHGGRRDLFLGLAVGNEADDLFGGLERLHPGGKDEVARRAARDPGRAR